MTTPELVKVSVDKEQLKRIKIEATRGKPYAPRISIALACRLLDSSNPRFNPFSVLDEIDYLEGISNSSRTKPEAQFKTPPYSLCGTSIFSLHNTS